MYLNLYLSFTLQVHLNHHRAQVRARCAHLAKRVRRGGGHVRLAHKAARARRHIDQRLGRGICAQDGWRTLRRVLNSAHRGRYWRLHTIRADGPADWSNKAAWDRKTWDASVRTTGSKFAVSSAIASGLGSGVTREPSSRAAIVERRRSGSAACTRSTSSIGRNQMYLDLIVRRTESESTALRRAAARGWHDARFLPMLMACSFVTET